MTLIAPGSTLGIIGGGQLGRMIGIAAVQLGYDVVVFSPEEECPAAAIAKKVLHADYDDEAALKEFAGLVDVATYEFENIPHQAVEYLESLALVRPSAKALRICQHRVMEKEFLAQHAIATAGFAAVSDSISLTRATQLLGFPCVLKTAQMGYDGKGQAKLSVQDSLEEAWKSLKAPEGVVEAWVDFSMEISVIVARDTKGNTRCYDPVQNIHRNHILDQTVVPAPISPAHVAEAQAIASKVANALQLVGVLAVEMFITRDGRILVNELAPRPHNSGHWSIDAAATSQFEQCVRAVCDLPLGDPSRLCNAEMHNLIGEQAHDWTRWVTNPNAHIHLYGKREVREGRKMGHVTVLKLAAKAGA